MLRANIRLENRHLDRIQIVRRVTHVCKKMRVPLCIYKHVARHQHTFRRSTHCCAAAFVRILSTQRTFICGIKVCYCSQSSEIRVLLILSIHRSRVYSRNNTETCTERNLGITEPVFSGKLFSLRRTRPSSTCMKRNLPAAEIFELLLFRYGKVSLY